MFVVSRKNAESVIIDGFNDSTRELKVTVLEVTARSVKLGFEVNTDVSIPRSQAWDRFRGGICLSDCDLSP